METLIVKSIKSAVKHWYIPVVVGLFFVIVSILAFTSPAGSLLTLALFFSLSFLFGGLSEIIFSITNKERLENWGWSLAFGIITFIVGLLLFINPALSVTTMAFYIGFILLFRSTAAISFALDVKKYGNKNWGGLLAFGILGTIFSFILIWNPVFAGLSVVILIAVNFLLAGLFSIFFGVQLRKLHKGGKELSFELQNRYEALAADIRKEWDERD